MARPPPWFSVLLFLYLACWCLIHLMNSGSSWIIPPAAYAFIYSASQTDKSVWFLFWELIHRRRIRHHRAACPGQLSRDHKPNKRRPTDGARRFFLWWPQLDPEVTWLIGNAQNAHIHELLHATFAPVLMSCLYLCIWRNMNKRVEQQQHACMHSNYRYKRWSWSKDAQQNYKMCIIFPLCLPFLHCEGCYVSMETPYDADQG